MAAEQMGVSRPVFRNLSVMRFYMQPQNGSFSQPGHVCPWWPAYTFDNPIRKLILLNQQGCVYADILQFDSVIQPCLRRNSLIYIFYLFYYLTD